MSVKSGLSFGSSLQQRFIKCTISLLHSPASIDGRSKLPDLTFSTIAIRRKTKGFLRTKEQISSYRMVLILDLVNKRVHYVIQFLVKLYQNYTHHLSWYLQLVHFHLVIILVLSIIDLKNNKN